MPASAVLSFAGSDRVVRKAELCLRSLVFLSVAMPDPKHHLMCRILHDVLDLKELL